MLVRILAWASKKSVGIDQRRLTPGEILFFIADTFGGDGHDPAADDSGIIV